MECYTNISAVWVKKFPLIFLLLELPGAFVWATSLMLIVNLFVNIWQAQTIQLQKIIIHGSMSKIKLVVNIYYGIFTQAKK